MLHRAILLVILFLGCGRADPSTSKANTAAKDASIAQANATVGNNGASDAGQTLCERAYASDMARIHALLSIPPAFQRCLTGSYAAGHHEECQAAMTPEEVERFYRDQK